MINEYLKQIIALDRKTEEEFRQIDQEAQEIEKETEEKIKKEHYEIIDLTKEKLEKEYEENIKKAQQESREEVEKAEKKALLLKENYERGKDQAATFLVKELLQMEVT